MKRNEKKDNRFYSRLNRLNQRVEWFLLEGRFHKGVKLLRKIIQKTKKAGKKTHQGLAAYRLAQVYLEVFAYGLAVDYFKQALKCLDHPGAPMTRTVSEIYKGLYECYTHLEDTEEMLKYAMLICEYPGLSPHERAEISAQIAGILLELYVDDGKVSSLIRGLTYARDGVNLYEQENVHNKAYVQTLATCGDIFYYLREYDQALKYLEKAYQQAGVAEVERTLMSKICYILSKVYAMKGEEQQALSFKNRSLELA